MIPAITIAAPVVLITALAVAAYSPSRHNPPLTGDGHDQP